MIPSKGIIPLSIIPRVCQTNFKKIFQSNFSGKNFNQIFVGLDREAGSSQLARFGIMRGCAARDRSRRLLRLTISSRIWLRVAPRMYGHAMWTFASKNETYTLLQNRTSVVKTWLQNDSKNWSNTSRSRRPGGERALPHAYIINPEATTTRRWPCRYLVGRDSEDGPHSSPPDITCSSRGAGVGARRSREVA